MYNKIIQLTFSSNHLVHYSFCLPLFFSVLFCFFFCFCFCVSFLLFSLFLTIIIDIFYSLNYASLLLHLIATHLVSHLSLSSIVFIISTLITGIFYCLDYTSSLYNTLCNRFYNKCLILKHNFEFIMHIGKEKYKLRLIYVLFYFHKISDGLPFTKGIVKLL